MGDIASRPPSGRDTTQQITDQTKVVSESAAHAGGDVVRSAKEQGRQAVTTTGQQARDLYGQVRSEVEEQARTQQKRAAAGLHAVADEAARMAERGGESGPATQAVRQASDRIQQAGRWLDDRDPAGVFDQVKTIARRHPGTFLLGAAVLGVMAGRFARNATGDPSGGGAQPQNPTDDTPASSTLDEGAGRTGHERPAGSLLDDARAVPPTPNSLTDSTPDEWVRS